MNLYKSGSADSKTFVLSFFGRTSSREGAVLVCTQSETECSVQRELGTAACRPASPGPHFAMKVTSMRQLNVRETIVSAARVQFRFVHRA